MNDSEVGKCTGELLGHVSILGRMTLAPRGSRVVLNLLMRTQAVPVRMIGQNPSRYFLENLVTRHEVSVQQLCRRN